MAAGVGCSGSNAGAAGTARVKWRKRLPGRLSHSPRRQGPCRPLSSVREARHHRGPQGLPRVIGKVHPSAPRSCPVAERLGSPVSFATPRPPGATTEGPGGSARDWHFPACVREPGLCAIHACSEAHGRHGLLRAAPVHLIQREGQ